MATQDTQDKARTTDIDAAPDLGDYPRPPDSNPYGYDGRARAPEARSSAESPSGAHRSASIAPTSQPAGGQEEEEEEETRPAGRATTVGSFVLGIVAGAIIVGAFSSGRGQIPSSVTARPGAPEPVVESPLQAEINRLQEAYPATARARSFARRHSGSFTAFDMAEAQGALRETQLVAMGCSSVTASQPIEVQVVFGRTGQVVYAHTPDRALVGDDVADCVEDAFRAAVISPFEGGDVSLTQSFLIPQ